MHGLHGSFELDDNKIHVNYRPKSREEPHPYFACCFGDTDGLVKGPRTNDFKPKHCKTLVTYFKYMLDKNKIRGDQIAIISGTTEVTYQQLDDLSSALAKQISKTLGDSWTVTNPDGELLIGVCIPMSERVPLLIFSILKLGAAYLPLGSHLPEDSLFSIIEKFGPIAVITDDNGPILGKYDAKQFEIITKVISVEDLWFNMTATSEGKDAVKRSGRSKSSAFTPLVTLNDIEPWLRPAYVTYTTEFHTEPSGVRIGHEAILNRCFWEWQTLPYNKNSVVAVTNTTTASGFVACCSPLLSGAAAQIFHQSSIYTMEKFVEQIYEKKVTRLHLIPSLLGKFLAVAENLGRGATEFERLSHVFSEGSTVIPVAGAVKFFEIFPKGKTLVGICGPAESSGGGIYVVLRKAKQIWKSTLHAQIVVGHVMNNTTVFILNRRQQPVPDCVQGEISISGRNLAMGYLNFMETEQKRPYLQTVYDKKKKHSNVFRTGMFGRIEWVNGKRCIILEGRADNQVEVNGFQIQKEELYQLINGVSGVLATIVLVYKPYLLDQTLVVFVEGLVTEENIIKVLSAAIPVDSMPYILVSNTFPRIETKIITRELIRLFQESREPKYIGWNQVSFSKEIMEAVKVLAEAMFKFAGIRVETTVNNLNATFYHLGGNSLNTLSVLLYLYRKGFHLTIYEFTAASSLLELADLLSSRMARKDGGKQRTAEATRKKALGITAHPVLSGIQQTRGIELQVLHKVSRKNVIDLLSTSYSERGILERYTLIHADEYRLYFNTIWQQIVDQQLSIVAIRNADRKIVAVSLNQDFFTAPTNYNKSKSIANRIHFTHELKGSVLNTIPHYKQSVLEVGWIATHDSLTPSENVLAVTMLMMENVRMSQLDGYTSIYCSTSHPLLQELCLDVLDFELLQVNTPKEFELTRGNKPFCVAPDSVTTTTCWLVTGILPPQTSSARSSITRDESSISAVPGDTKKRGSRGASKAKIS